MGQKRKFAEELATEPLVHKALAKALLAYSGAHSWHPNRSNVYIYVSLLHEGHMGYATGKVDLAGFKKPCRSWSAVASEITASKSFFRILDRAASMYLKLDQCWSKNIRVDVLVYRHGCAGFASNGSVRIKRP
jgi:hypothetical protein